MKAPPTRQETTTTTTVRRATATLLAGLLLVAGTAIPAGAATADPGGEATIRSLANGLRASLGLDALTAHPQLDAKARAWAMHMAAQGGLSHSHLPDGISADWQRLGENVGRGPTVQAVHEALVASPSHYENLTDPGFRYVGVGVVITGETVYVSQVFMQSASQPAPATSAPAAGTPSSPPPAPAPPPEPAPAAQAAPPPPPPAPPVPAPEPEPPVSLAEALGSPPPALATMLRTVRALEAA